MNTARTYGVGWTKKSTEVLIRLAVELEFLQSRLHWDAKGHVINAITDSRTELDFPGRLLYMKFLMEGDGAILVHLVHELGAEGEIERSKFLNGRGWEKVLEKMCQDYLSQALPPSDRRWIRSLREYAKKGYAYHTREHWFNPRAESLVDLHIWSRQDEGKIRYIPREIEGVNMVKQFSEVFDSVLSLDRIFSSSGDFFARLARLYQIKCPKVDAESSDSPLKKYVLEAYETCRDDAYRLASLAAIRDVVCTKLLVDQVGVCEWSDVDSTIQRMRQTSEKHVRYHVDDWGRPSYLVISEEYVKQSLPQLSPRV